MILLIFFNYKILAAHCKVKRKPYIIYDLLNFEKFGCFSHFLVVIKIVPESFGQLCTLLSVVT